MSAALDTCNVFPETNLAGEHQRANAATALLAANVLSREIPVRADIVRTALKNVNWPARWQTLPLPGDRRLIVDAAHNAECAGAVEPLVAQIARDTGRPPLVITGVLGLERARPLLAMLTRHARRIHLVRPEQERACSFADLEAAFPPDFAGEISRDTLDALFPAPGECAIGHTGDTILALGSVYLAGEILGRFEAGAAYSGRSESALQDKLPEHDAKILKKVR